MGGLKHFRITPEHYFVNNILTVRTRGPNLEIEGLIDPQIVGVCSQEPFGLILKVEKAKHLRTYQIVVSINYDHYLF